MLLNYFIHMNISIVGTDSSRPLGVSIANEDAMNRSLQKHHRVQAWGKSYEYKKKRHNGQ